MKRRRVIDGVGTGKATKGYYLVAFSAAYQVTISGREGFWMEATMEFALPPFELLGSVRVLGMRAEVRRFPRVAANQGIWTAPSNVLTFRFAPGNTLWTRSIAEPTDFVPAGPLTFRPRASSWETRSNGAPVLSVTAFFDAHLSLPEECAGGGCSVEDLSMIEMMRLLHDEICTPGFATTAMIESISEMIHIKLSRLMRTSGDVEIKSTGLGKKEIALIHDYIEAQTGRAPSVTELATLFNTSRRSLLRRFRRATAMTVTSYITQVQITKAKRLLADSDMLIKQVATETGFKSPTAFAVAFERNAGLTPTAFRNRARGSSRSRRS